MLNTLYGRSTLVLGGLLIAIGMSYVLVSQSLTHRYMLEAHQRFNRDLARNLVVDRHLVSRGRLDREALRETFHDYMIVNPGIEIYLLDLQGTLLAYSADPGVVKRNRVSVEPIRAFLSGEAGFPLPGDDPRSHDQRKIFSVTEVPSADRPEGYLYVVLRGETYDSIIRLYQDSLLLRLSAWTLAGSLAFGLITGLLIFFLLTRRLRQLARCMDGFRHSDFRRYQPYGGGRGDEIDQLGRNFDRMAARMQVLLSQLNDRDALRRELVDNVSHDLRTPLTSLHGCLETLKLKENDLDVAERRDFLDTALRHSDRLGRLVGELFELAKLEARAIEPGREPFSPAELIQDVSQKFRLPARQKHVELRTELPEDCCFVAADIGLIERVLENLIANALHHTPPRGAVLIKLECREDTATLSVTDTGAGIAPDDLPHVFERWYRGTHNRQDDEDNAGLGLAIARQIIELHDSALRVSSHLNAGTRFAFSLSVWKAAV